MKPDVGLQLGFDGTELAPKEIERRDHRAGKTPLANPMLRLVGPGPEGRRCGDCVHLLARSLAKTYYKCELRSLSGSATSDHRVRWPACSRFEERDGGVET